MCTISLITSKFLTAYIIRIKKRNDTELRYIFLNVHLQHSCATNQKDSCKECWVCTQISFQNAMQLLWIFQSATFVFQSCICVFQSFVQSGCDRSGFRKCASSFLTNTITGFNRSCETLHATAWAMF